MTVNEALDKCIETLKNIKIPVGDVLEVGIPLNDVANTQAKIRAALEPKTETE